MNFFFDELIKYKGTDKKVFIPDFIHQIKSDAFKGADIEELIFSGEASDESLFALKELTSLVKLKLPKGITKVPSFLFKDFKNLFYVVIPSTVKEICESAFENCESLTYIEFGEGYITLKDFKDLVIGTRAFKNCTSLVEVVLPDNTIVIGEESFMKCVNLETLLLPLETKKILTKAFADSEHLCNILFPPSTNYFGNKIFGGCCFAEEIKLCSKEYECEGELPLNGLNNYTKIKYVSSLEQLGELLDLSEYNSKSKLRGLSDTLLYHEIEREDLYNKLYKEARKPKPIQKKITRIEHDTFFEENGAMVEIKQGIEEVIVPESIKSIEVKINPSVKKLVINSIYDRFSFFEIWELCKDLEELVIGDNIKYVDNLTKIKFPKLRKIVLGKNVKQVFAETFKDFESLEVIEFHPESNIYLFDRVFENCNNLKMILNSNAVNGYGDYCFKECTSLKEFVIGAKVQTLNVGVFNGCSSLEKIGIFTQENKLNFNEPKQLFMGCDKLKIIEHRRSRKEIIELFKELEDWIKNLKSVQIK